MKRKGKGKKIPKNAPVVVENEPYHNMGYQEADFTALDDFENAEFDSRMHAHALQAESNMSDHQVALEKRIVNERLENNFNSLHKASIAVSGNLSRSAGRMSTNTSMGFGFSSISPTHNAAAAAAAAAAQGERTCQEQLRLPQQDPRYNEEELNAALLVIRIIMRLDAAEPFNVPVDPIALGIPDYFDVVDKPMDFGTICKNLVNGVKYVNSEDVFKDVQLIWENCCKYNKKGNHILELMKRVKKNFMKFWAAAKLYMEPPQTISGHPHLQSPTESNARHSKHGKECPLGPDTNNSTHQLQDQMGPSQDQMKPSQVQSHRPSPMYSQSEQPPTASNTRRSKCGQGSPVGLDTNNPAHQLQAQMSPGQVQRNCNLQPLHYLPQPDTSSNQPQASLQQPDTSFNQPQASPQQPDTSSNEPQDLMQRPNTSSSQSQASLQHPVAVANNGKRTFYLWQNGPSKRRDKVVSNHEVGSTPKQSETPRSDGSTIGAVAPKNKLPTPRPVAPNTQPTTPPVSPNTLPTTPPIAPNTQRTDEQANIESTAASVQRISVGRGANSSKDVPENPEDREVIHIVGTRFQPNSVVRQIVSSIKNQMGPYPTWLSVAKDLKNELWAEFQETYQFINEVENRKARKVWEQVCAIRYKDLMKKARDEAKKKTGLTTYNFEKMAEYPPSFMKKEYWVSLCEEWNKESWRKISNSGSTNRKKGGKLNHVGGSIPFISHAKKLENEKKTKPTHIEVFDLTHQKDGVYCNDKARKVGEKYKSDISQKYGNNLPIFDADIWTEASGGIKKGRVFGFCSSEDLKASGLSESISTNASTSRLTPSPTSPDMQSLILAAMETPQFQAMMDARQKQLEEAMRKEFQEEIRKLRENLSNLPNSDDVDVEDEYDEDSSDGNNEDGDL